MEKKMLRLDGLEQVVDLPSLDGWMERRLARLFPPISCRTAAELVGVSDEGATLKQGDVLALLFHLKASDEPHDAACPERDLENIEARLARLRAQMDSISWEQ